MSNLKLLQPFHLYEQDVPAAFVNIKRTSCRFSTFDVNGNGTVIYTVLLKMRKIYEDDTGEVTVEKVLAEVETIELITGRRRTYSFDEKLSPQDMNTAISSYILRDHLIVIVTYDFGSHELCQIVVLLTSTDLKASILYKKKRKLMEVTYTVNIGFSHSSQQIVIIGTKGVYDGPREVVAYRFAADPMHVTAFPDEEMTPKIVKFVEFLKKVKQHYNIFANGIFFDQEAAYFLIKENRTGLKTDLIGKLTYKTCLCELIDIKGEMIYKKKLRFQDLNMAMQRGRDLWLLMDPPNFDELTSWSWRIYRWLLPHVIAALNYGNRIFFWINEYIHEKVGVFLGRIYIRLLVWLLFLREYPDQILHVYHLDLRTAILRRADIQLRLPLRSGSIIATALDHSGGLLFGVCPINSSTIAYQCVDSPCQPPTLARLATYRSYRLFPAFERSDQLRYMLGQTSDL